MNSTRPSDEEQLQSLFDGAMEADEFEALQARLATEPDLRALYYECNRVHHLLSERFGGLSTASNSGSATIRQTARSNFWAVSMALAATIALAVALLSFLRPWSETPAQLVFGENAHGNVEHIRAGNGEELFTGSRLSVSRGGVEITFPSGVQGFVEGPAVLVGRGKNAVHIEMGRAWFEVPKGAEGFLCTTDSLTIEDYGTEFGVWSRPGKAESVQVLEGEVRLFPTSSPDRSRSLAEGDSITWSEGKFGTLGEEISFARGFASEVLVFEEVFDESAGTVLEGKKPDRGSGLWTVARDGQSFDGAHLSTSIEQSSMAFAPLDSTVLNDRDHIMHVTVEIADGKIESFHSDGWAGVSLYTGDQERIFIGDPAGESNSWAIQPFGGDRVTASPSVAGKSVVTLRYDFRTGLAELFDGERPEGEPVASEWIAPGLSFDSIRIANGAYGDTDHYTASKESPRGNLALKRLGVTILVGE